MERRLSRCTWLERDAEGRPSCEHGRAIKEGSYWSCPLKAREKLRRYRATQKGRETWQRYNHSPKGQAAYRRYNGSETGRLSKALYDLVRPPAL